MIPIVCSPGGFLRKPLYSPMPISIDSELQELRARSLLRTLRQLETPQQPDTALAGRKLLNFSSNDYLGLASEPALREAAKAAIDQYGVGSGASRLVCGTLTPHVLLEERLAEFKGTEAAIAFSSGYAAAVGTIGALLNKDDVVILDKLCHASLIDGAKLSGAAVRIFPHNHLGKLESHLEWARDNFPDARVLVVTEAVFSMDGDWALLSEIVDMKERFGAMLLLDEAHSVGVIGQNGRGLANQLGLGGKVDVQLGTMSKALGVSGGYVCASRQIIELLINRARSFVYSTAPPPAIAAAATAAIEFMMSPAGEKRRQLLRVNLMHFFDEMPHLFPNGKKIQSAIIPILIGEAQAAVAASRRLGELGFLVPAIRFPTVARDTARLRITLSARHTHAQISALCAALKTAK
ncbi:MAG: 8-amino-7-ketopelargonate synthase [Chthoniobacteraceae bacterium]|nr:8-amino-7-ketopelargonate synthase [Chthoniobacteraceae bacterium]